MTSPSSVGPYKKHIFVCVGDKCAKAGEGMEVFEFLKEKIRTQCPSIGPERIFRSKSSCLGICERGPVAVVYPEGIWYGKLNCEKMARIFHEHLQNGKPVREDFLEEQA